MKTSAFTDSEVMIRACDAANSAYGAIAGGARPFWRYHASYQPTLDALVISGQLRRFTQREIERLAPQAACWDSLNWLGYYTPEAYFRMLEALEFNEERTHRLGHARPIPPPPIAHFDVLSFLTA